MRGLQGKVAVVAGGLGDLGYATAKRLAEEGCKVMLFDLAEDSGHQAEAIGARFCRVDIADESSVRDGFAVVAETLGPCAILINSAATFIFKSTDAATGDWEAINRVNIAGTATTMNVAALQMKANGGGSIVNFSSVSGFIAQKRFATYNATKFAIRGLTKCYALDLAPDNIRVNCLCPGYIYTSAFVDSCRKLGLDLAEEDARASAMHILGRQGRPEEVASAAAFLASEESSFMTGSDLLVDGGYLAL